MNAERLLTLFERVADAPGAVGRLRELLLDLAVQGKLASQDRQDEPADQLLCRIEKAIRDAGGKPSSTKAISDPPFSIPSTWAWTQLARIGEISPRNDCEDDRITAFIPMPLIFSELGRKNEHEPRPWGEIKKGYTHFAEGDVGLAKITPCFENGKSTIFENLSGGIGAGTTELHIVRPYLIDPQFILIFLKSPHFIKSGIPKMTGTAGQKRIPRDYFAYSPFPLPPLAEQHRIVQRVDELMALCDQLEAAQTTRDQHRDRLNTAALKRLVDAEPGDESRETACFYLNRLPRVVRTVEQVKALRQTVLDLAVRGKLVVQVEAERTTLESELKKFNDLPSQWKMVTIGDLLRENSQNGFSRKPDNDPQGTPILKISAGTINGDFSIAESEHKLIGGIAKDIWKKFSLEKGDLLACRFNGNRSFVGRLSIFLDQSNISPIYPDKLIRLRVKTDLVVPELLCYFAGSDLGRADIEKYCATTVGNWGISASNLKKVYIPLPPYAEQPHIVNKVRKLWALCDELHTAIQTRRTTTTRLLDALIAEAISDNRRAPNPIHPHPITQEITP